MRSSLFASTLAIVLGVVSPIVSAIGFPEVAIAQENTGEIDRAIEEGNRLFKEGSAESLRKAILKFEKAIQLSTSIKNKVKKASALRWLGAIHNELREKQKAIDYYHQSLLLYRAINDRANEASVLGWLGAIHNELNEKQKAINYYHQSLVLYRAINDRPNEASVLNWLGAIHNELREKQKAIDYYHQSLLLYRAINDRANEASVLGWLGAIHNELNEKQKAINYYHQSLVLYRAINDRANEASVLGWLGAIHNELNEKQKAINYYHQSLVLYRAINDRANEASVLGWLGAIHDELNEKQKSINYYNQSLSSYRAVNDQSGEFLTLYRIGGVHKNLDERQKALEYYNRALSIINPTLDRFGQAVTLTSIGDIYFELGDNYKALEYQEQSLRICRTIGDRKCEARVLYSIGIIYSRLGENYKAIDYYSQSLILSRSIGDRSSEISVLTGIGSIYNNIDKKQKALDFYNQALLLVRVMGSQSGESPILNNIGLLYSNLGEKQKALDFYNQALLLRKSIISQWDKAATLTNIGAVYSDLGEEEKALKYYEQSLPLFRKAGYRFGEARLLTRIGLVYFNLGQMQKALEYYNQSLPLNRLVGDRAGEASTLNNIASVYETVGKKEQAFKFYNQALSLRRAVGDRSGEAKTLKNIASILNSQKQSELAIVFYKRSVSVYETLRQEIRTLPKETQETYTKTFEQTYRNLADLLIKANRILEAQQVLDLLKVQELNTYLSNVRGKTPELYELPPETEILKKYGEIQTTAIELGQTLTTLRAIPEQTRTKPQQQEIDRLVQLQIALNQQFNEFTKRPDIKALVQSLARRNPDAYDQTIKTASLDALRDDLKKLNAVLIYPLILDDRLELIITTPDSPPLRRTVNVKREELNQAITDFRAALQNPKQDAKPIAQKLYNWLIKPLEADLKSSNPKTLIYAPDAQLRYIPIAALHDGTQWLTQRYAINHITAQSLTDLTAQPTKAPKILAGAIGNRSASIALGSDTFNFGGLAYTTKEVQSIQQLQPTTRILDGDAFSLNNVTPKLGDYNILHLATHAALVPKKVENSFILFGSSTFATLRDIESWTLNNFDLVVLSACETGLGGKFGTGGEEILGLGYQFQSRGAKATIASLWQVDDGGTQILMTAFYSALKQGHSKTKALQLAQSALITNDFKLVGTDRAGVIRYISKEEILARSSHPAYWAPFILIGNGL